MNLRIQRHAVTSAVVLANLVITYCGTAESSLPDIDALLESVKSATEERDRLLENSRGNGLFEYQRGLPPCERRENDKRDFLPPDEEGILWTKPASSPFDWAQRGVQHRLDQSSLQKAWTEKSDAEAGPSMFCVDASDGKGFIDTPPIEYGNLINFPRRFDIDRIYHPRHLEPLKSIPHMLEQGYELEMRHAMVDGVPCIHVAFANARDSGEAITSGRWVEFYFAPIMNFALLKATDVSKSTYRGGQGPFSIHTMSASYYPDAQQPDVWILKTIDIGQKILYHGFSHLSMERISIVFEEIEVGVEIPEDTFTFAGLGLPEGAPIYDLRIAGIRVEDSPAGLCVHPDSAALFWPLSQPVALSQAFNVSRELLRGLPYEDQQYLYDTAKNKTDIPTIYSELYRTLALSRLKCAPGDFRSLLEYGLATQDESFIRVLLRPYLPSESHPFFPEWSTIAIDLVGEDLSTNPQDIGPLHVETLLRAVDIPYRRNSRPDIDANANYDRAIQLMAICLSHENPRVREAAVRLLPSRFIRTTEALRCITNALQGFAAIWEKGDTVSEALLDEVREKMLAVEKVGIGDARTKSPLVEQPY